MTRKQLLYLWQYLYAGSGGAIVDGLVLRPNFNDMANLSLTSPSNGSAVFNGSSDYVDTGAQLVPTIHTIQAWVYRDSTGTNDVNYVLAMRDAPSDGILFFSRNNTSLSILFDNQTEIQFNSFTSDQWHHVVSTYDGTTQKLYFNGSVVGTATFSDTLSVAANAIIARDSGSGSSNFWDGNLANVAIWNRALTSDEINSIMWKRYDLLTAGESTGLVAWYALDDITGTSVPDSTGTYNATAY